MPHYTLSTISIHPSANCNKWFIRAFILGAFCCFSNIFYRCFYFNTILWTVFLSSLLIISFTPLLVSFDATSCYLQELTRGMQLGLTEAWATLLHDHLCNLPFSTIYFAFRWFCFMFCLILSNLVCNYACCHVSLCWACDLSKRPTLSFPLMSRSRFSYNIYSLWSNGISWLLIFMILFPDNLSMSWLSCIHCRFWFIQMYPDFNTIFLESSVFLLCNSLATLFLAQWPLLFSYSNVPSEMPEC